MVHRKSIVALVTAAVSCAGVGTAFAAHAAATKVTITTPESQSYKINRYTQFGLRWNHDTYTVAPGATISIKNLESDEPHTLSLLKQSQMPTTKGRIEQCGTPDPTTLPKYAPCRKLFQAHAPDKDGNPKNPLINVGKAGLDQPGDSLFIAPKGAGPVPTIKVSAKKGTTLYFVCLVHPWMQAKLVVR